MILVIPGCTTVFDKLLEFILFSGQSQSSQFQNTSANSHLHHSIPIPTNIWLVILLTVCYTNLVMLVWRICYWINTNNPFIGVFLFSHYLSAWYCFNIIRRNSVLVSHGSYTIKGQIRPFVIQAHTKWFVVQWRPLGCCLK